MNYNRFIEITNVHFEMLDAAQALAHALDIGGPDSPVLAARLAAWRVAHAAWIAPLDSTPISDRESGHE